MRQKARKCLILECSKRSNNNFCCADCKKRDDCENRCQNSPEKCGMVEERKYEEDPDFV